MDNATSTMAVESLACAGYAVHAEVGSKPDDADLPQFGRVDLIAVGPDDDGKINLQADGRVQAKAGESYLDIIPDKIVAEAGMQGEIGLRCGMAPVQQHIELQGTGKDIVIENGQIDAVAPTIRLTSDSIILSVGPNEIKIGMSGIEIKGLEVSVDAKLSASVSGTSLSLEGLNSATLKGGVSAEVNGAQATLKGAAMTTIKGGVVMIN
ncbi:MAG: hypothetical protein R3C05_30065 [Pirellulaceae bacterium]